MVLIMSKKNRDQVKEILKSYVPNDKYFEDEITLWVLFYHWTKIESNPFLYYHLNETTES
jgi:hypothetical protein